MTDYIYNRGSGAHRGVWHIAQDVIIENVPESTRDYESSYDNATHHYVYPAHRVISANVLCNSIPKPWFAKDDDARALKVNNYPHISYRNYKKRVEHQTHEVVAQYREEFMYQPDPPYPPAPLCRHCERINDKRS